VVGPELLANLLDDSPRELAVGVDEPAVVELVLVEVFGDGVQFRVLRRLDPGALDGVSGGNLAVALDVEDRHRLDGPDRVGVEAVLGRDCVGVGLCRKEGDVVVGRVRRHRHHHARRVVGVDELRRENLNFIPRYGIAHALADQVGAPHLAVDLDLPGLQFELLGRRLADDPALAVDGRTNVGRRGVHEGVGHAADGLGT